MDAETNSQPVKDFDGLRREIDELKEEMSDIKSKLARLEEDKSMNSFVLDVVPNEADDSIKQPVLSTPQNISLETLLKITTSIAVNIKETLSWDVKDDMHIVIAMMVFPMIVRYCNEKVHWDILRQFHEPVAYSPKYVGPCKPGFFYLLLSSGQKNTRAEAVYSIPLEVDVSKFVTMLCRVAAHASKQDYFILSVEKNDGKTISVMEQTQ